MKKNIFVMAALTALFLTSCAKEKHTETVSAPDTATAVDTATAPTEKPSAAAGTDEIVKSTAKDKSGKTLEMSFNNTKNTATVVFEGETIDLKDQRPASGIWYKNDHYELRGKGEQVELTKDGKVVFSN
ncbi:MliC family protein [Chryseobacterium sp.]|uniref:MliC family protein n=1 Tax=Chryseobacterium sp. TaxID=1871047 RepID=UPI0025BF7A0A|nr:MliC family protein [Chryseobacterium sp.]